MKRYPLFFMLFYVVFVTFVFVHTHAHAEEIVESVSVEEIDTDDAVLRAGISEVIFHDAPVCFEPNRIPVERISIHMEERFEQIEEAEEPVDVGVMIETPVEAEPITDIEEDEVPLAEEPVEEVVEEVVEDVVPVQETVGGGNRWGITFTEWEIDLLARIVYLESHSETNRGEQAVITVVFNRMASSSFPNTVEGVLSAPGQFTTYKNRSSAAPESKEYNNIYDVLEGKGDPSITGQSWLYFQKKAIGTKIDTQYFH